MKLYATVTSERASKGQGGNEYLDIDILVRRKNGAGKHTDDYLARLTVREADHLGAQVFGLFDNDDNLLCYLPLNTPTKGEKQKTE